MLYINIYIYIYFGDWFSRPFIKLNITLLPNPP